MSRSPSPRSSKAAASRRASSEARLRLRDRDELSRADLLALDFSAPRERVLSQVLSISIEGLTVDDAHALTLAERHAWVWRAMLHEGVTQFEITAECPGCRHKLELALDLGSMSLPTVSPNKTIQSESRGVRLPTPADLESSASREELFARLRAGDEDADAIEDALAAADPLAEIEIAGTCTECGSPVSSVGDLAGTWLARVRRRVDELLEEIHLLASRYHWSEKEILEVPDSRRRVYIDLCWRPIGEPEETHAW
jgi:hypothetical protein